jgi:hypothetical protein
MPSWFDKLVELFKTPAMSALIAAASAIVSAALSQSWSRRTAEGHWFREQRAKAYSELISALDHLANVQIRLSRRETEEDLEDFKAASEEYRRARTTIELYAPQHMIDLLDKALDETIAASFQSVGMIGGKSKFYAESALALAGIRPKVIQIARDHLRGLKPMA